MSISVDGTYWSVIVFNKDQLTHPACVQFMGENQQSTLAVDRNQPCHCILVSSFEAVVVKSKKKKKKKKKKKSLHPGVIV